MYCTKCGMRFDGRFCPVCGKPAAEITYEFLAASKRIETMHDAQESSKWAPPGSDFVTPNSIRIDETADQEFMKTQRKETGNDSKPGFLLAIKIVVVFGVLLGLLIALFNNINNQNEADANVNVATPTPVATEEAESFSFPSNGSVYYYTGEERIAPFSVSVPYGDKYYYVTLVKRFSGTKVVSLCIDPGRTVEVDIPVGDYNIYYCSGETWYGLRDKFGPEGHYATSNEVLFFTANSDSVEGQSLTLYPVANGNMDTVGIDPSEFPQ